MPKLKRAAALEDVTDWHTLAMWRPAPGQAKPSVRKRETAIGAEVSIDLDIKARIQVILR